MSVAPSKMQSEVFAVYPRVKAIIEEANHDGVAIDRRAELQVQLGDLMVSWNCFHCATYCADNLKPNSRH
jgi:hypothetical protein